MLEAGEKPKVTAALAEFERSMRSRPDDATSNTSLGNYFMNRGDLERALQSYRTATRLQPDWVPALVNSAMAYNALGRNDQAEQQLRTALRYEPANAAAQFNLGLLLGEVGRPLEAKGALRAALKEEPSMAAAAYNLCVLEAQDDVRNAIPYCRQAAQAGPREPKYTYTLAFFLNRAGDSAAAASVLRDLLRQHPDYSDARGLLAQIAVVAAPSQ
jgi:tetratricopeptide (TPR) repeat protein